jgi:hypothetical protein
LKDRLVNVDSLHAHFRKKDPHALPAFHPRIIAFRECRVARLREAGDTDYDAPLFSTATIKLPFPVQRDILDEHRFVDKDGVRLVYVDLRAEYRTSYIAAKVPKVEIIDE